MVNYHKHSHYTNPSVTDSTVTPEDYCKRAVELKHGIISSCEHGTKGNIWLTADLAEKYGLKWRYVAEAYWVKDRFEKDRSNNHIILAAKTEKGVYDLNDLLTEANDTGFYGHPRVDLPLLLQLDPADVFVTSACMQFWKYDWVRSYDGKILKRDGSVILRDFSETDPIVMQLFQHFGKSFMLEVQPHNDPAQIEINKHAVQLNRKYGIGLIAGMDSHYIYPQQQEIRQAMIVSKRGSTDTDLAEEDRFMLDYPDDAEFYRRFQVQGVLPDNLIKEAMDATDIFYEFEDVKLRHGYLPVAPKYQQYTQEERNKIYSDLVWSKWEEFKQHVPPERHAEYEKDIQYEVDVVTSTNKSDYFLIDYDMVQDAIANGGVITKTGRGSASGWFSNTLLGFSSVDRHVFSVPMLPDRFISVDRLGAGQFPDLDLNVANERVFAASQEKIMGAGHAYRMINYSTMQRSGAWKMYARAKNIPYDVVNRVSNSLKQYELDLKYSKEAEDVDDAGSDVDIRTYIPPEFQNYQMESEEYLGIITSSGISACSYILSNENLRREIGLVRRQDPQTREYYLCAEIDGRTAERYGYVKNDILHVDVCKTIGEVYKRIGMQQPVVNELLALVKDDPATWKIYHDGLTMCVNQCEREKTVAKLQRYAPKNVTELSYFVAGIRPGFASMVDKFLGRENFTYGIPVLDQLLANPDIKGSYMPFQEQVMVILQQGGLTGAESYKVIKAISKKKEDVIKSFEEKFTKGFVEYLVGQGNSEEDSQATAKQCWQIIMDSASYLFNGCLTGDTKIVRVDPMHQPSFTIAQMYQIVHAPGYPKVAFSANENGEHVVNDIVDIRFVGKRPVYVIKTASGLQVRCSDRHKFPVYGHQDMVEAEDLHIGDVLFRMQNRVDVTLLHDPIVSIEQDGWEDMYDVEMAAPYHNLAVNGGLIVGNSHAVCMALDSLYIAYAKAHYPLETYAALLKTYADKKNRKEEITKTQIEMKRGFHIQSVPCRFRSPSSGYMIDAEHNTITESMSAMKGIGKDLGDQMDAMKDFQTDSFIDLLYEMCIHRDIKRANVFKLIQANYFIEYGQNGKLTQLFYEFAERENRLTKQLKPATMERRLAALHEIEPTVEDVPLDIYSQLMFEMDTFSMPRSTSNKPEDVGLYFVTDLSDFFPKTITCYRVDTGAYGKMRVRKALFQKNPISAGDMIKVIRWKSDYAGRYQTIDGQSKWVKDLSRKEIWLEDYQRV